MTCNSTYSESGFLCSIQGCAEYLKLKSERDHLQGVVQGMTEQGKRNTQAIITADQRILEAGEVIETLDDAIHELIKDRDYFEAREKAAVQERDRLAAIVSDLIDIASGQTIYDEINKRYTHSFMADGEALWRLLGLDDKRMYVPAEEFHGAVEKFKEKVRNGI